MGKKIIEDGREYEYIEANDCIDFERECINKIQTSVSPVYLVSGNDLYNNRNSLLLKILPTFENFRTAYPRKNNMIFAQELIDYFYSLFIQLTNFRKVKWQIIRSNGSLGGYTEGYGYFYDINILGIHSNHILNNKNAESKFVIQTKDQYNAKVPSTEKQALDAAIAKICAEQQFIKKQDIKDILNAFLDANIAIAKKYYVLLTEQNTNIDITISYHLTKERASSILKTDPSDGNKIHPGDSYTLPTKEIYVGTDHYNRFMKFPGCFAGWSLLPEQSSAGTYNNGYTSFTLKENTTIYPYRNLELWPAYIPPWKIVYNITAAQRSYFQTYIVQNDALSCYDQITTLDCKKTIKTLGSTFGSLKPPQTVNHVTTTYAFSHWADSNGKIYAPGSQVVLNGDLYLWAVFSINSVVETLSKYRARWRTIKNFEAIESDYQNKFDNDKVPVLARSSTHYARRKQVSIELENNDRINGAKEAILYVSGWINEQHHSHQPEYAGWPGYCRVFLKNSDKYNISYVDERVYMPDDWPNDKKYSGIGRNLTYNTSTNNANPGNPPGKPTNGYNNDLFLWQYLWWRDNENRKTQYYRRFSGYIKELLTVKDVPKIKIKLTPKSGHSTIETNTINFSIYEFDPDKTIGDNTGSFGEIYITGLEIKK